MNTHELLQHRTGDAAAQGKRGTLYMVASRGSGMLVGLLSSAVMGRLLSPGDYGLVAMATSVMILLNLLKDFGLTTAVIQREGLSAEELDAVFWINLLSAAVLALLGAVGAPWVARFYSQPAIASIVYALCVALLLVSMSGTHGAMLRRHLNFEPLMWSEVAGQLCGLVIGVGFAWWTRSYWAIVLSQLASSLAGTLVLFHALRWVPGPPRRLRAAGALVRFGANLSVFSLLNFFSNQLGAILTGAWLGAGPAGHFNRAQQLLNLSGSTLMSPISQTTLPVLSRLQGMPADYRQYYTQLLQRTGLFFGLLGAFVIVCGDAVARVLLGPQWDVAGQMYRWFGLSIMAVGLASQTGNVLLSQSRSSELRHWGFGDAAIRAGASAAGVAMGAVGVAAAFGVSTLFITVPIVFWLIGRAGPMPMRAQWQAVRPGLVSAAAVVLVGLGLRAVVWPAAAWLGLLSGLALLCVGAALAALLDPAVRQLWAHLQLDLRNALAHRRGKPAIQNAMTTRPKVIVFRSDYLPVSETFISDHLRTLTRYEPLVVCQRDLPANHRTAHPVLQVGQGRLGRRLFEDLGWAPALSRLIAREQPALVHAHFLTDAAKLLPFMARNRLPFIVTAHGFDATTYDEHLATFPDGARLLRRRAQLMQRVDKILCVSQFIKDELLVRGYPAEKLEVSHLGIDLAQFAEPGRSVAERKGILAVGRLVEKKGTHLLIDAWARLPAALRAEHPLLLIGDGPLRDALNAQAASLQVQPTFLGARPRAEVLSRLREAAVFCLPSIRAENGDAEGMPIAIMEALASQTPVCIFDDQPMTGILKARGAGQLPRAGNADSLAEALAVLLGNAEAREANAQAGRAVVEQYFDLAKNVPALEICYDKASG